MKQIALKEHLQNRLRELKEERRQLKNQKMRSIKETQNIFHILEELEKRSNG